MLGLGPDLVFGGEVGEVFYEVDDDCVAAGEGEDVSGDAGIGPPGGGGVEDRGGADVTHGGECGVVAGEAAYEG